MKKIITLCAVILTLAVVLTAFTACDTKPGNEETVTDNKSFVKDDVLYSAVVGESSIVIMSGDEVYQTLSYPVNSGYSVDVEYAQNHYEFIDMNFDGIRDFYVALGDNGGIIHYFCWLFNDTSKKYDYSVTLSALRNISVDSANHRIISTDVQGGTTTWTSYKWENGVLTFDSKYSSEDESVPEEVTNAAQNNAIGIDTTAPVTNKNDKVESGADKTTQKNKLPEKTTKPEKTTDKVNDKTTEASDKTTEESDKTTSQATSENKTTEADKPVSTTKPNSDAPNVPDTTPQDKPLNTTTTAPATQQDIFVNPDLGSATEGWF